MENSLNHDLVEQTKKLIKSGSYYNTIELDTVYASDLRIVRLDHKGTVTVLNKVENMSFFREREKMNLPPLDTDHEIHYAEVLGNNGYVFLTRRMNISGAMEELKYHIHWKNMNGHWKIIHENVYAQPLPRQKQVSSNKD